MIKTNTASLLLNTLDGFDIKLYERFKLGRIEVKHFFDNHTPSSYLIIMIIYSCHIYVLH